MQDDEGHIFGLKKGEKERKKNAIILRTTGWLKLFMPLSASQVFSYSRPWCYLSLLLLVSGRINTPTRLNCVPGSTTAPFSSVVLAQNEAITLDLHDCNCGKYAKPCVKGFMLTVRQPAATPTDSLAALCLVTSFRWTPPRDPFPLGCVCVF